MSFVMPSNKKVLLNTLCRICAREDSNFIPIFGVDGMRQNIVKKINICLPVNIREDDIFPKQICLTCLTKLESFWDMHVLCKEAQFKIEKKLNKFKNQENVGQENCAPISEDPNCGVCNEEVKDNDMGVGCEGPCQKWFHCSCINMNKYQYDQLVSNPKGCWTCRICSKTVPRPKIIHIRIPIEEKIRELSESYRVSYGDSAVICLAPETNPPPPPPTAVGTTETQVVPQAVTAGPVEPVMAPVTYLAPAPTQPAVPAAPPPPPPSVTENVYPQTLIQIPQNPANEQPVVYQNRSVTAAPAAPPPAPRRRLPILVSKPIAANPQRPSFTPLKRQNGESPRGPPAKQQCIYCSKYFSDDNIDHHISLHLRQTFSTCLDCDKNFRSEEALQRHRCEVKTTNESDSINLDPDDEDPIVV